MNQKWRSPLNRFPVVDQSGIPSCVFLFRIIHSLTFLLLIASLTCLSAHGQSAENLSQATKIYVDTFSGDTGSTAIRSDFIRQLQKTGIFHVVSSAEQADAVIKGTGQLWVKGHIAVNPRVPENNRKAIYGGYLSVELIGKNNETLWSYLVTPTRSVWEGVTENLAQNMAKQLVEARKAAIPPPASAPQTTNESLTTLEAAGATFPAPLYEKWFESFQQRNPNVRVNYRPIGSEAGTQLLLENKLDFAASDIPPTSSGNFRHIASVLGGVVPIYNIKDMNHDLRFTPEILAGIYLGEIKSWNDPKIQAANRGISLPNAEIVVVHRTDGSGTTWAWSDYLSKVSSQWKAKAGTAATLQWPVGVGAEGNNGVASKVQQTPYSLGYVELVYAIQHQLSYGAVRNSSGEYIRADLDSIAEAAKAASTGEPGQLSSITNSSARRAYPIATFTWLLLPVKSANASKEKTTTELMQWILTSGQKECAALGYAPLPPGIAARQLSQLNQSK